MAQTYRTVGLQKNMESSEDREGLQTQCHSKENSYFFFLYYFPMICLSKIFQINFQNCSWYYDEA